MPDEEAAKVSTDDKKPKLQVELISPFQTYYQGDAASVSAANSTGPFDILPNHANFFTLLTAGTVSIDVEYDTLYFKIGRGIAHCHNNKVKIFLDI